jgi:chromosomal replication initiator protein
MFTNEFINALGQRKMPEFRNKYRNLDVLLIDDIQFIEGKERIQEEFFHTFNALHDLNKQIVISSDTAPNKIQNIDDRLKSRFQWNMIADISNPDYETRVAILRKKADIENIELTQDLMEVIDFIAEKIKFNIRELEGALLRVITFSSLMNEKIDLKFARKTLKDVLSSEDLQVTPQTIKKTVCKHFNIKTSEIESSKRTKNLAYPRQIAMYICKDVTGESLPKIGEIFGGRDHTTVLHACQKISAEMKTNESLRDIINTIEKELNIY